MSFELPFLIITDIHPSNWKQTDGVLLVTEGYGYDEESEGFAATYRRIGVELGCEQIGLENIQGPDIPKLFTAPGVDASDLFLVER